MSDIKLNTQQLAAVQAPPDRPIIVVASPGSGKTAVLTLRVAHLISEYGAEPGEVVVTTFTRRAADEMKERLQPLIGSAATRLQIGTIHSVCLRILREEGLAREVISAYEQKKLIREELGYKRLNWDVGWRYPLGWIMKAKGALVGPRQSQEWFFDRLAALSGNRWQAMDLAQKLSRVYRVYEQEKRYLNRMDFADMLMWTAQRLFNDDEFRTRWQRRAQYVLVDECVPGSTPVLLADGSSKTIEEIVEGRLHVEVMSYDVVTGQQVVGRVMAWHKIPRRKVLYRLVMGVPGQFWGKGQSEPVRCVVVATEGHEVWTEDGWKAIERVGIGERLLLESSVDRKHPLYCRFTNKYKHSRLGKLRLQERGGSRGRGGHGGTITRRGGNGRGPTEAEKTLLEALGQGWQWSYVVSTGLGGRQQGYPSHYKIDLAYPEGRVAIEVDGRSHNSSDRKKQDDRKDAFLRQLGWRVVRVRNMDALTRADEIAASVFAEDCPVWAEVLMAEPIETRDMWVYDLTVDETHCYFANGVLVHNCQDMSSLPYGILRTLSAPESRFFAVGDPDQCILGGERVLTRLGWVPIEDIQPGDLVDTACGQGRRGQAMVKHKSVLDQSTTVVRIVTERGHSLRATYNHVVFASPYGLTSHTAASRRHYVYLMWRPDKGYRIGYSSIPFTRQAGDHPYKIWLLAAFDTMEEARFHETLWSTRYGIPQETFFFRGGRGLNQSWLDRLFEEVKESSVAGAERLADELGIDLRYPHRVPQNVGGRATAYLTMCADGSAHLLSLETSVPSLVSRFGERFRLQQETYENLKPVMDEIRALGGEIVLRGNFVARPWHSGKVEPFLGMAAGNVLPGMLVPVVEGKEVVADRVVEVRKSWENVRTYDLQVTERANFVVGGVVVHNSLFRWNGADPEHNIFGFREFFPDGLVLPLEINYRSTKTIVATAAKAIAANYEGASEARLTYKKTLKPRPGAPEGMPVAVREYADVAEEAAGVRELAQGMLDGGRCPQDVYIVYRVNSQSRAVEDELLKHRIPYVIQGSLGFYDRKVIKDMVAYLALVYDENDDEAFQRVANIATGDFFRSTRGFGSRWMHECMVLAKGRRESMWQAMLRMQPRQARWQQGAIDDLVGLVTGVREQSGGDPRKVLVMIREQCYEPYLLRTEGVDESTAQEEGLFDDLDELGYAASQFKGTKEFLDYVDAVRRMQAQRDKEKVDAVVLSTIHRVKGLERPVVFGIGLSENVLPHKYALTGSPDQDRLPVEDLSGLEDERCAVFVLVSRAKEELHLSYPLEYRNQPVGPSRFLEEMELLEEQKAESVESQAGVSV